MTASAPRPSLFAIRLTSPTQSGFLVEDHLRNEKEQWVGPLNTLNVFIGPNNCGKSRLLRSLFTEHVRQDANLQRGQRLRFNQQVSAFLDAAARCRAVVWPHIQEVRMRLSSDVHPVIDSLLDTQPALIADCIENASVGAIAAVPRLRDQLRALCGRMPPNDPLKRAASDALNLLTPVLAAAENCKSSLHEGAIARFSRVYIPALRSLRPAARAIRADDALARQDTFAVRTAQDYFSETIEVVDGDHPRLRFRDSEITIKTGQDYYLDVLEAAAGSPQQRGELAQYTAFLSARFFRNQSVEITPRIRGTAGSVANNTLHMRIGKGEERPIFELGDGIAQIVILTWPMFLNRHKKLLLFIEEPELYLHPGFQRMLIDVFLDEPCIEEGERQVFVATHSNCFVDATLDSSRISVFSLGYPSPESPSPTAFVVRTRSTEHSSILRELGIQNSSVLLANCTIWVEGITDRLYLRRYLQLCQDRPAPNGVQIPPRYYEGIHFAFVEYGGSTVTHLSYLSGDRGIDPSKLCGTLCLVTDSDGAKPGGKKYERNERLKAVLGTTRFRVLESREVENLLTPVVLEQVIRSLEPESPKLATFKQEDYKTKPLGRFIQEEILLAGSSRPSSSPYSAESGTLKDKVAFADRAIAYIQSWDDLSPEAQELTLWLYEFIQAQNSPPPA